MKGSLVQVWKPKSTYDNKKIIIDLNKIFVNQYTFGTLPWEISWTILL